MNIIDRWNEFGVAMKIISLVLVCCIGLVIVGGIIGLAFPDLNTSYQQPLQDLNIGTGDNNGGDVVVPDKGLQIKITCPGKWSASVSNGKETDSYEDSGNQVINLDESDYDVIGVAAQKQDKNKDEMIVEIIKDGEVVAKESTADEYGVISTSYTLNQPTVDDNGLKVKVTYPDDWSGSIGDQSTSTHYEGHGDKVIDIEGDYDVIAAAMQKKDKNSDEMIVEIIKDGEVLSKESTTDDYGVVTVSASL